MPLPLAVIAVGGGRIRSSNNMVSPPTFAPLGAWLWPFDRLALDRSFVDGYRPSSPAKEWSTCMAGLMQRLRYRRCCNA